MLHFALFVLLLTKFSTLYNLSLFLANLFISWNMLTLTRQFHLEMYNNYLYSPLISSTSSLG